jgi:hypothetical protein
LWAFRSGFSSIIKAFGLEDAGIVKQLKIEQTGIDLRNQTHVPGA